MTKPANKTARRTLSNTPQIGMRANYRGDAGTLFEGTIVDLWEGRDGDDWATVRLEGSTFQVTVRVAYLARWGHASD